MEQCTWQQVVELAEDGTVHLAATDKQSCTAQARHGVDTSIVQSAPVRTSE
jgi:hypothetical protein